MAGKGSAKGGKQRGSSSSSSSSSSKGRQGKRERVSKEIAVEDVQEEEEEEEILSTGSEGSWDGEGDSSGSEQEEDDPMEGLYSAKMRYKLNSLNQEDNDVMEEDDEKEGNDSDRVVEAQQDGPVAPLSGPLGDLVAIKGTDSVRCKYCAKLLINEKQVLEHIRSALHKKKYRQAKLAGLSKKELAAREERIKAKKAKRAAKQRELRKANRKSKAENLSDDQIAKRKAKFAAKKARKLARKQQS